MASPGRGSVYLALLALLALSCGPGSPGSAPETGPGPAGPNILLVVVDTLGAEHVGAWADEAGPVGQPPLATTPHLDALCRRGVRFRHAYSPAPWTQPAIASLLTGRMPSEHGLVRLFGVLDDDLPLVPALLGEHGYATAGVVSHKLVGARYGFDRGFAHWDESVAGGHKPITSQRVTDAALAWLDGWQAGADAEDPFFLYVHYFDPHYVYNHHPEHDRTSGYSGALEPGMGIWDLRDRRRELTAADVEYLVGLYREEVAFTDAQIGRLLAGLEALGVGDETAIVITADHGEELMRHGWIGHTRTLYDELLHVPLVIVPPPGAGGGPAAGTVDEPVSLVDLAPTLLDIAGVGASVLGEPEPGPRPEPDLADHRGLSLRPLLAGSAAEGVASDLRRRLAERTLLAEVSFSSPEEADFHAEKSAYKIAAFDARFKAIRDLAAGRWQLFDRQADPEELAPLGEPGITEPALERLMRRLRRFEEERRATEGSGERLVPEAEEIERLRALGYLR